MYAQTNPSLFAAQQIVKVGETHTNAFRSILDLAALNRVPLGIVVSQNHDNFCDQPKDVTVGSAPTAQILDALLMNTRYSWSVEDGVLFVRSKSLPESSDHILKLAIPEFGGGKTTFSGQGVWLWGYITSELQPGSGFAVSILSSSAMEEVGPFTLKNVDVQQIANHIVSLGRRGVWVLYPVSSDPRIAASEFPLKILGYSDDASAIRALTCTDPLRSEAKRGGNQH